MPHRCRHIRGDGEASVPTGKSEERPGEADARESGATGPAADRTGARRTAQSRHRQRNGRRRFADGLDPARKDTPLPDPPPQVGREQKDAPPPTRLQPPADNSRERRSDFAAAHTARKSAAGFDEAPQSAYRATAERDPTPPLRAFRQPSRGRAGMPVGPGELDPDIARALGIEEDNDGRTTPPSPRLRGEGGEDHRSERGEGGGSDRVTAGSSPSPGSLRDPTPDRAEGRLSPRKAGRGDLAEARDARDAEDNTTASGGLAGIASQAALERLLREGRPEFTERPWTPHRPRRPDKTEGGVRLVVTSDFEPQGRPTAGDRRIGGRDRAKRAHAGAARRHRLGQDLHHGEGDRGDAAPRSHPRAQQDARRPALWRIQELFPRQRGRVFRQLLRLLPAGSLCAAH